MKRVTLLFMLLFYIAANLYADDGQQVIINQSGGYHSGTNVPDVQPDVYYNNVNQEIIIIGTGFASYYNVVIASVNNQGVLISTQVNGDYDTIDISSLTADEYSITITTQWNDIFIGYFEVE